MSVKSDDLAELRAENDRFESYLAEADALMLAHLSIMGRPVHRGCNWLEGLFELGPELKRLRGGLNMPVSQSVQQVIDQAIASRDAARAADQAHVQALGDMEKVEAAEKQAALQSVAAHKTALADMDAALTALRAELDAATGGGTPPAPAPPPPAPTP